MNYTKEIEMLKKENKKLREALKEHGIDVNVEVLGKKLGDILNGKELRIAADKGLKVHYVLNLHDPYDKNKNMSEDVVMERCTNDDDEYWCYIGDSDICIDDYSDEDKVVEDFDEGIMSVHKAKGVKYI
jgi:hypothetical protein